MKYLLSFNRLLKSLGASLLLAMLAAQATAQVVIIDLGSPADGRLTELPGWNNITNNDWDANGLLSNFQLVDTNDNALTATFSITSRFTGINAGGAESDIGPFVGATAVKDNWYFTTTELNPVIEIGGLDAGSTYTFDVLASRNGIGDTRSADLTVSGSGSTTMTLDASNNTSTYVTFSDIAPDVSGVITLSFVHSTGSTFAYLNGLQITGPFTAAVPEPGTYALILGFIALVGIFIRRRQSV